jgi:glycosyltransferase involved in cell wall biosynthesis
MKVLLIGNYQQEQQQSMLLFGELLYSELKANGVEVELWQPKKMLHINLKIKMLAKYIAYIDKFILGSINLFWKAHTQKYSVFHILDHGNSVYAYLLPPDRTIITCHDCIAIEEAFKSRTGEQVGMLGKLLQSLIIKGLEKTKVVACVSNATKKDLQRLTNVADNDVKVIYNSAYSEVTQKPKSSVVEIFKKHSVPIAEKYIFSLGNNLIRKNRLGVINGYLSYRLKHPSSIIKLWLAGKPFNDEMERIISNSQFSEDIRYLSNVDDELLSALYSACEVFCFPSIDEGFGVPIIEAQICNALVITSDKEPMREVAGEAAILVDPYDTESIAGAFSSYSEIAELIKSKNSNNIEGFSKEMLTKNYLYEYRGLIKK